MDRDTKREALLRAALVAVATRGIRKLKVSDVAETAGVAHGTVYQYFKNKQQLLEAVYRAVLRPSPAVLKVLAANAGPAERLMNLLETALRSRLHSVEHARMRLDAWVTGTGPDGGSVGLADVQREHSALVRSLIDAGVAAGTLRSDLPAHTPVIVNAALDGLVVQWAARPDDLDADALATDFVRFLNGALKPSAH
ncbi:MAG: TetR/AcrR family transcriptional regulator [Bacteroidota bacterium]